MRRATWALTRLLRREAARQGKTAVRTYLKKTYDEDHWRKSRGTKLTSIGFDASSIAEFFVANWTFSNVARYGTSRATQTRTEARTLCREESGMTGRHQLASRFTIDGRADRDRRGEEPVLELPNTSNQTDERSSWTDVKLKSPHDT
jgi:hypothetical protein